MGFVIYIILLLALQYGLSYLFQVYLDFNPYISETLINLVLSIVFTIVRYKGVNLEKLKDPKFHGTIAKWFVILMLFSFIYWWIF